MPSPDDDLPGIDLILPDIRYLVEQRRNILGIVLTHAHEDHFGAMIDLWPRLKVPVYATPFTAALLQAKRESEPGAPEIPVNIVPLGGRFTLGPFDIELVSMAHSIPESNGLIIRTPLGAVLHTGDWKIDPTPVIGPPTDEAKLRALGDEGCLALIGDSTNAVREGRSPSETDVAKSLAELIRPRRRGSPSPPSRPTSRGMRAVAEAAARLRPRGRAGGPRHGAHRLRSRARPAISTASGTSARSISTAICRPDKVLALCTGSQGEPRAALSRIAEDDHPEVAFSRGDRVIFSSRAIPGNEKAVMRVINGLVDAGHRGHHRPHPSRPCLRPSAPAELGDMIGWVRPQILLPVHGEALHMAEHAALARRAGRGPGRPVPRWRSACGWRPAAPAIIDEVPAGRLYKDGSLLVDGGRTHRRRPPPAGLCRAWSRSRWR